MNQADTARRGHSDPLFEQVADGLRSSIDGEELLPGQRAPSLRITAARWNVSMATVVRAYEQLEREGRLRVKAKSGYYVAQRADSSTALAAVRPGRRPMARTVRLGEHIDEIIESAREPDIMPFGLANPSPELLPGKALRRALRAVGAGTPDALLDYAPLDGEPDLRRAIAARSMPPGLPISPDDIVITSGATEALALALRVVTSPGDTVIIEAPAYFGLLRLLESFGLRAMGLDGDPVHGMDPVALERVLAREPIAAVVSIGTFNNPTGSLVPDEARQRIVSSCVRHGVTLIEDDLYADLHAGGHAPLPYRSFDTDERVVTCSSFSKTLAPGFRIGWVVSSRHRQALLRHKLTASGSSPRLTQLAMARFLTEGRYDRHLGRLQRQLRDQLAALRSAVRRHFPAGTRCSDPSGGFVLWVRLPGRPDTRELYRLAIAEGISIAPGSLFSTERRFRDHLRLAAAEPWTDRHERAIERLGELAAGLT